MQRTVANEGRNGNGRHPALAPQARPTPRRASDRRARDVHAFRVALRGRNLRWGTSARTQSCPSKHADGYIEALG